MHLLYAICATGTSRPIRDGKMPKSLHTAIGSAAGNGGSEANSKQPLWNSPGGAHRKGNGPIANRQHHRRRSFMVNGGAEQGPATEEEAAEEEREELSTWLLPPR